MSRSTRNGLAALLVVGLLTVSPVAPANSATDIGSGRAASDDVITPHQGDVVGPGVRDAVRAREGQGDGAPAGTIVVMLDDGQSRNADVETLTRSAQAAQDALIQRLPSLDVQDRLETIPAVVVDIQDEATLDALAADPAVRAIDLDSGGASTSDPPSSPPPTTGGTGTLSGAVAAVNANDMHALGITGDGVKVAVFDSGIDSNHTDLVDDVVASQQRCFGFWGAPGGFCPNGTDTQIGAGAAEDDVGHGTHVSGIITSAGILAPDGSAPDARIVAVKVLGDCGGSGCFYSFELNIVAAADWIIANNHVLDIDIINMSLSTSARFAGNCDNATSWTMAGAAAFSTLRSMGVTSFGSSGNEGSSTMGAPGCLSSVISVGATNDAASAATFTDANSTTDIFAPGVNILSDYLANTTVSFSGTSMASPMAAGCAALLIESNQATTPAQIQARLETSGTSVSYKSLSFPFIDCYGLVNCNNDGATVGTAEVVAVGPFPDVGIGHVFCAQIQWLVDQDITEGYGDGTYRPGDPVTRGSMAAFLFRYLAGPYTPPLVRTFSDVPTSHLFYEEIEWLEDSGITGGFEDGTFKPGAKITRGAMAAFLYRAAGEPAFTPPTVRTFPDVPTSHGFFKEIEWLAASGITGGFEDGNFHPGDPVTRGSMAAFINRFDSLP